MRTPVATLTWEIWRRNRGLAGSVVGLLLFSWLFNAVLPGSFRTTEAAREGLMTLNCLLAAASLLFVFGIFNYTELNARTGWTGFPYRLFALPVATWVLVAVPILLGIAVAESLYLAWLKLVFVRGELDRPAWFAALIGAYTVYYQTVLWTFAGVRTLRIIVLGLIGTSFVGVAFLPSFAKYFASPWFSESVLIPLLVGAAALAFIAAWNCVARQRRGGGRRRNWFKAAIERISDAMPRRRAAFRSSAAAQFWFEWRRAGWTLPLSVGALLLLVIGPISWHMRDDSGTACWILMWTLAMPVILALPIGKGFSAPDAWSKNMAMPPFVAIRPFASGEIVMAKLKVAALSAVTSWLLVVAFLSAWLPFWAKLDQLAMVRVAFWMAYGHSMTAQYFIGALSLITGIFVTWKFLVGGLWVGLSGSRKWFVASAAAYALALLLAMIANVILLHHVEEVRSWVRDDPNRLLSWCVWLAAACVIAKFWLAAFSWRNIRRDRVQKYLLAWFCGTICLIALALLLWAGGLLVMALMEFFDFLPLDPLRLRGLLILVALLVIPFARIGLAPASLAKNRHR
jgi:hypothetical protein